ncbi:uncharacterized protein LOC9659994 [Selaginella moellendorffii]|nr:uncharacterized protein LOC9659994 [Selaginella moellendorffii]XP_024520462.1 uncharacterized protein LOC9659994 [Selaginella moellendorffii]|eukprot:XP_002990980.2 uncharacterized protein LOC9659994 [Selaginella moellendorffii]
MRRSPRRTLMELSSSLAGIFGVRHSQPLLRASSLGHAHAIGDPPPPLSPPRSGGVRMAATAQKDEVVGNGVAAAAAAASAVISRPLQVSKRLEQFQPTVFTLMSSLALTHQAINLGQGFPNFDGPDFIREAAIQALRTVGRNQYARGFGVPELNAAISRRFEKDTGLKVDPDTEITVTCGCTEAISSTILGLLDPGDEIIMFAPFFDVYQVVTAMVGAKMKTVVLRPENGFAVPEDELRAAFTSKTRAILVNTPHNPTGKVFSRGELELIASLCVEHDVLAFTDEVYSRLVFDGEHVSLASIKGMFERTVTMSSMGKTYSFTGWKVGWAIAPPHLSYGIRQAHSNITFSTATPLQWGAVAALEAPESYYQDLRSAYIARKDILVQGLKEVGFKVYEPQGTYFVMVDHTPFGFKDDMEFCMHLVHKVGVAAIPPSGFYEDPQDGKHLVRFAFCKDEDTLKAAVRKLRDHLKY